MRKRQPILGIVGHAADKFTSCTERLARQMIRGVIDEYDARKVVSGRCPLGGIDEWAIEEAERLKVRTLEFPPQGNHWEEFKARNIRIAVESDIVVCIVVAAYPPHYRGRRFSLCYHCKSSDHVKSGGCWTAKYARQLGKQGEIIILDDG